MKLKTYTAPTMAQALAQVRKDLGPDAMILHTRSYRTGSWLGFGGKPMVEITASSPQPKGARKSRKVRKSTETTEPVVKRSTPTPAQQVEQKPLAPVAAGASSSAASDELPEPTRVRAGLDDARSALTGSSASDESPTVSTKDSAPIQDRAALLQGLMDEAATSFRHRRKQHDSRIENTQTNSSESTTTENDRSSASDPTESIHEQSNEFTSASFPTFNTTRDAESSTTPNTPTQPMSMIESKTVTQSSAPTEQPIIESTTPDQPEDTNPIVPESDQSTTPSDPVVSTPEINQESNAENEALKAQIEQLQKMMGQVLDTTRRTAIAVNQDGVLPQGELPGPLQAQYTMMVDNDVPIDHADRFIGNVRNRLDADELDSPEVVRHGLLREIESSIEVTNESLLSVPKPENADRPHIIALIGPTGVGKTTTVAKLAATAKLRHGKRVALITSDTYRIAAVEQLKTYASIIGLDIRIANTPEEMTSVIQTLRDVDMIVIDTAGRSQNNNTRLDELGELIKAAQPDETHLVLSSTVGDNVLRKTAERFRELGPDRCILTKIDEAVTTGMIASATDRIGLPLSFVTVGQEVPDDILPARADRLARAVLDGPMALVSNS